MSHAKRTSQSTPQSHASRPSVHEARLATPEPRSIKKPLHCKPPHFPRTISAIKAHTVTGDERGCRCGCGFGYQRQYQAQRQKPITTMTTTTTTTTTRPTNLRPIPRIACQRAVVTVRGKRAPESISETSPICHRRSPHPDRSCQYPYHPYHQRPNSRTERPPGKMGLDSETDR